MILGPVAPKQIIDKLYAGELTPASEVQQMGSGRFVKLAEVPEFKVHVAKAAAKQRIDAQTEQHHAEQKQKVRRGLVIGVSALGLVGVVVAALGSYLAVHGSTGQSVEELAWGDITIDAPTISKARRAVDEELVDYQGAGGKKPATGTGSAVASRTLPGTGTPGTPKPGAGKPRPGQAEDPEGLQMGEVDEEGINTVVARHKPSLIPCIKAVAKPGVFAKIPIEFSIAETGKVTKVWVDNPDFKDSGLQDCLLQELQKWPFKPGQSGASVNLSFNIGKKG